jgi:hypothetical protein
MFVRVGLMVKYPDNSWHRDWVTVWANDIDSGIIIAKGILSNRHNYHEFRVIEAEKDTYQPID